MLGIVFSFGVGICVGVPVGLIVKSKAKVTEAECIDLDVVQEIDARVKRHRATMEIMRHATRE